MMELEISPGSPLAWTRLRSGVQAYANRKLFRQVERFCLFLGHPRSGHSLIGALLDAHPDAVIAHELNALGYLARGFTLTQIWTLILENARQIQDAGRQDAMSDYRYDVPGQWQGRNRTLRVIGDKKGGMTTLALGRSPDLLARLKQAARDVELTFIHVIRNPFDNISTMFLRNSLGLSKNIEVYFKRCELIEKIKEELDGSVYDLYYEDFVADPEGQLARLVAELGLQTENGYLRDCAGIVYASPNLSRHKVGWPDFAITRVRKGIESFSFLSRYTYES